MLTKLKCYPPSVFYAEPAAVGQPGGPPLLARFCFAKRLETLHAAGERLGAARIPARQAGAGAPVAGGNTYESG